MFPFPNIGYYVDVVDVKIACVRTFNVADNQHFIYGRVSGVWLRNCLLSWRVKLLGSH